jgi:hypothetical protein
MENYIKGEQIKAFFSDGSQITAQVVSIDDEGNLECVALSKNEVYKEGDHIFLDSSTSKIEKLNLKKKANSVNEIQSLIEGKTWKPVDYKYINMRDSNKAIMGQLADDEFYMTSLTMGDKRIDLWTSDNYYEFNDVGEKEYDSIMKPHLNDNEDEEDFESYSMKKKSKTFNWEFDKHRPQWKLNKESMEIERDDDAIEKIAKLRKKLNYKK